MADVLVRAGPGGAVRADADAKVGEFLAAQGSSAYCKTF